MIAVVGVGAVGGACAGALGAVRDDLVLCVRTPFVELVVETPEGARSTAPRIVTSPRGLDRASWLLLATKAHQVEGAAPWLRELIGPETRVAVLQNGVEHVERVRRWVEPERVLPVVVDCPARVLATGHVALRRAPTLAVPDGRDGTAFAALFAGSGIAVEPTRDFVTALWHKLCINVTGGAIAALAGVPLPAVRHPRLPKIARALARECAAVARAAGAQLGDPEADRIAHGASHATTGGSPSTLHDRLAGRALEADARNGAVVRIGVRHGIEAPFQRRATELLATCHRRSGDLLSELAELP